MPGRYFDQYQPGETIRHSLGRTLTEMDNVLFSALTMNPQPLHLNEDYAQKHSPFGRRIVNGIFTLGLAVGLTVTDLTEGTLVANLGYDQVRHPHPLFHGDTLYVETEVLEVRAVALASQPGHRALPPHRPQPGRSRGHRVRAHRPPLETGRKRRMIAPHRQFPRRSLLFMPGDSLPKIEKAAGWEVDTLIMDLEDGVALNRKAEARQTVAHALGTLEFGPRERLVRVNHLSTGLVQGEIDATVAGRPDGYVAPKVEDAADLRAMERMLDMAERRGGLAPGSLRLFAMIETALGVMNLRKIARATPRLVGLIFGAEDLASDLGAVRTRAAVEVLYARSAVVVAAAAYDLQAFDMIFADFHDIGGLEEESRFARQLGFTGKTCIHPKQTPVVNRAFSPAPEEIARAQRLVHAFEEQQAAGAGAFTFEGAMVDMPMLRAAHKVLARAGLVL